MVPLPRAQHGGGRAVTCPGGSNRRVPQAAGTGPQRTLRPKAAGTGPQRRVPSSCPRYRFNLINLMKPDSLFSSGMRPLLYSEGLAAEAGVGWTRCGDDIAYFMNQCACTPPAWPLVATCPEKSRNPRDPRHPAWPPLPRLLAYSLLARPRSTSRDLARPRSAASPFRRYAYTPTPKKPPAPKKGQAASKEPATTREATLSSYYTLTFTVTFPRAADTCYLSQCYPYTFTMQQATNGKLVGAKGSSMVRRETLCHSYGGNAVDLLSVTDFSSSAAEVASRRVVVISARVHPGETNASWMMAGLLQAVTADTDAARRLRRSVMLKIVPMLNPDGVILGNYRCSAVGVDLNRQWAEPHETRMPTIFALKRLMKSYVATDQASAPAHFSHHTSPPRTPPTHHPRRAPLPRTFPTHRSLPPPLCQSHLSLPPFPSIPSCPSPIHVPPSPLASTTPRAEQLLLFCDLHGHSRKRNIFAYGCENAKGPQRLRERIFPRLLADCCPHFSNAGCSYKVLRYKETTISPDVPCPPPISPDLP